MGDPAPVALVSEDPRGGAAVEIEVGEDDATQEIYSKLEDGIDYYLEAKRDADEDYYAKRLAERSLDDYAAWLASRRGY